MDYLRWFRKILGLPIKNGKTLTLIEPQPDCLNLTIDNEKITTTKLILATGRGGFGGAKIPHYILNLPKEFYSHANDQIDIASCEKNI